MTASTLRLDPHLPADELYKKFALGGLVFAAVFLIFFAATLKPPYDIDGFVIGRDFINTWMGSRTAFGGGPAGYFDFYVYNAALRELLGANYPEHIWSYPPHLLLFTWPFGLLPYFAAFAAWSAAGVVLYFLVASGGDLRRDRLLFLAAAPAVLINLWDGQNGFFSAALLIGGLTNLDRRPILSGMLFGILTIKPQLGILLPIVLLLGGHWRAIAAAALTTAILLAATAVAFGSSVWADYVNVALAFQRRCIMTGSGLFVTMMPTMFMNIRLAELPVDLAIALQTAVSIAAIAALIWTFWRRRDPLLSAAFLVTAIFVATPYAFNYDMVVFGWVIAQLRDRADNTSLDHGLAIAVWTLPIATMVIGVFHLPLSALALIAFAARLVWRLANEKASFPVTTVPPLPGASRWRACRWRCWQIREPVSCGPKCLSLYQPRTPRPGGEANEGVGPGGGPRASGDPSMLPSGR